MAAGSCGDGDRSVVQEGGGTGRTKGKGIVTFLHLASLAAIIDFVFSVARESRILEKSGDSSGFAIFPVLFFFFFCKLHPNLSDRGLLTSSDFPKIVLYISKLLAFPPLSSHDPKGREKTQFLDA